MSVNLLLTWLLAAATAGFCFFIANRLGSRKLIDSGDKLAWQAFRVWWWGLGATTLLGLLNDLLPLLGLSNLVLYVTVAQINVLIVCAALGGLVFYLAYLFTGRKNLARPIGVFYLLFFLALAAYVFWLQPIGLTVTEGSVALEYAKEPSPAYLIALILLILLPQLIASLAYFTFYFRVRERAQKYRVALVSGSIFFWFASPLVASMLSLDDLSWWPIASRLINLLAALVIYWAYYPPRFIQNRFGVQSI
jgi:hypothetical protein